MMGLFLFGGTDPATGVNIYHDYFSESVSNNSNALQHGKLLVLSHAPQLVLMVREFGVSLEM